MFWLRTPEKLYFKKGSMPVALDELKTVYGKKKAFIVTEKTLYQDGEAALIEKQLDKMNIQHTCYFNIENRAALGTITEGSAAMQLFEPDVVIAFGGQAAIDAAKAMRICYEIPGTDLKALAGTFNNITDREYTFPSMAGKSLLVAIKTINSNGSEVSPYGVIDNEGETLVIADYNIMPAVAIADGDYMLRLSSEVTAKSGLTAMAQALFAYSADNATEYTDGFVLKAVQGILTCLPTAYQYGAAEPIACEKLGEAMVMAGIAYANTNYVSGIEDTLSDLAETIRSQLSANVQLRDKYATLAMAIGITGQNDAELLDSFINHIDGLVKLCGFGR